MKDWSSKGSVYRAIYKLLRSHLSSGAFYDVFEPTYMFEPSLSFIKKHFDRKEEEISK